MVSVKSIIGAVTAGAVVGVVMGMVLDPINDKQHRRMYRCANNVFKTIGSIIDDVINV